MTELMPKDTALKLVKENFKLKTGTEEISVEESFGRIAGEDVRAVNTIPVVRSAGGDGIAVRSADFADGMPDTSSWRQGEDYVRADTGDDFDDAFDAVIMIESVKINDDGSVVIAPEAASEVKAGLEVVSRGANVREGELIVKAGSKINHLDMAAMITAGAEKLKVRKKPRVGFIPTGSELVPAGVKPERGQNVDGNSILVKNLIESYGGQAKCYPIVADDEKLIKAAIDKAFSENDIIIVNGGSSKGEQDYNSGLLKSSGRFLFHRCAAAPGMPMSASAADDKLMINLPGPTMGAFYCMEWFVKPIIVDMMETAVPSGNIIEAVLAEDVMTPPVMEFLCMVNIRRGPGGAYEAYPLTFGNSRSMERITADGSFLSPVGTGNIKAGTKVKVELYRTISV